LTDKNFEYTISLLKANTWFLDGTCFAVESIMMIKLPLRVSAATHVVASLRTATQPPDAPLMHATADWNRQSGRLQGSKLTGKVTHNPEEHSKLPQRSPDQAPAVNAFQWIFSFEKNAYSSNNFHHFLCTKEVLHLYLEQKDTFLRLCSEYYNGTFACCLCGVGTYDYRWHKVTLKTKEWFWLMQTRLKSSVLIKISQYIIIDELAYIGLEH